MALTPTTLRSSRLKAGGRLCWRLMPYAVTRRGVNVHGYGILILPTTGRYFQIPYRSLLPKKIKNLLVAGRAIGGDRVSHAAVRNMSCCAVTGQGAGIAAALSLKSKTDLHQVGIRQVQAELDRQGVRFF